MPNEISDFAFVSPNAILGTGNVICEGVVIRDGVVIGDNNYIGAYCIIGDLPEKNGFWDKPLGVVIGNNNRFSKQVTIDAGTERNTMVCNNVTILKNGHVGHDALIFDGVIISCNAMVGGWCVIGKNSNLGLGSAVHQRSDVPEGTMLGMNSTITKKTELKSFRKYAGSPARDIGDNHRGRIDHEDFLPS